MRVPAGASVLRPLQPSPSPAQPNQAPSAAPEAPILDPVEAPTSSTRFRTDMGAV